MAVTGFCVCYNITSRSFFFLAKIALRGSYGTDLREGLTAVADPRGAQQARAPPKIGSTMLFFINLKKKSEC